jgi:formyl-CoA transferase
MTLPLKGVRVVELAAYVFVPVAGAVLADLGADVIRVEPPTGDPFRGTENAMTRLATAEGVKGPSPFVEYSNRGKRSMTIDLETEEGHELLLRLVATADVFLTSYLENVRKRLRVDVDDIRAANPSIIYARGSGWGSRGPMRSQPGFDLVASWAGSGVAHLLVGNDGEPPPMPMGIFDVTSGNALAGAIGTALYHRNTTGEALVVDTSLMNTGMWAVQGDIVSAQYTDRPGRMERSRPGNALVNWYRTADDRWIYFVMMNNARFWDDFCVVIGRPELLDDPRFTTDELRTENTPALAAILEEVIARRTLDEWRCRFRDFKGAWGPMLTPGEMPDHPQVKANGFINDHRSNSGFTFKLVAPPMQFGETPTVTQGPAPEAGQHTEEILLELGCSWDEIGKLHEAAVIGTR